MLADEGLTLDEGVLEPVDVRHSSRIRQVVPGDRVRYLAEIAETVRGYHATTDVLVEQARRVQRLDAVAAELADGEQGGVPALLERRSRRPGRARVTAARAVAVGRRASTTPTRAASRSPATGSRGWPCRATPTTASWSGSGGARTCPGASPSPPASSRSSARTRTRPGCSPARATRRAPTGGSSGCPRASPRRGSRRRSTRSPSTAATPTSDPTSTARSARPASASRPSTT